METNTTLLFEPVSGDERLESLIAGASISLLEISNAQIYSLYKCDYTALWGHAADMSSLVEDYRAEAEALEFSPGMAPAYEQFFVALDEFAATAALFNGSTHLNQSVTDDGLHHLALGIEHLSGALLDCNLSHTESPDTPAVLASLVEDTVALFPDSLQIGERFVYEDERKENSASLIVGPITWSNAFQTTGTKQVRYAAELGKAYLLVTVRVTHLGHKGEGANTVLQTPEESAFLLHYAGETSRPLKVPGPTTRGEPYSKVRLNRHESTAGYLFFEVPDDLDPAFAHLRANIGGESPAWVLGERS
ncbi:hypothetical protein FKB36_12720 [Methanoculleus sp. Afa-1]|uniref:Uncharacterized protein n=1 Tax=Methanoculleus formosensis TaxID=2590886 RepID=A0A9E5DF49_9EURY|nr:hypothetical protein [Methanoculleus sp. Afa-1]MCT8338324.1 hypothetical protein [Methanoculleus sp. Afa-1]